MNSKSEETGPRPTKEDLIYLAGFVDGEGSFAIRNTPGLIIANTYLPILREIKEKFGGTVAPFKQRPNPKWRQAYRWCIYGQNAVALTRKLYPFLREKKQQADIFCEWYEVDKTLRPMLIAEITRLKHIEY